MTAKADLFFDRARQLLGSALPCRAGCDVCCHQDLTVVLAEAVAILVGLTRLSTSQRRAIQAANGCCALLVDQRCAVYEHRPLVCRTHGLPLFQRGDSSTDAAPLLIDACACSGIGELDSVPPAAILNSELLTAALGVADGLVRQTLAVESPIRIAISRIVREGAMALPDTARERLRAMEPAII